MAFWANGVKRVAGPILEPNNNQIVVKVYSILRHSIDPVVRRLLPFQFSFWKEEWCLATAIFPIDSPYITMVKISRIKTNRNYKWL